MYELDAIAAVTVGGISHSGGIGTVSGMVAGIMILAVVENGLILLGVSPTCNRWSRGASSRCRDLRHEQTQATLSAVGGNANPAAERTPLLKNKGG
jgi:hypothetical protein